MELKNCDVCGQPEVNEAARVVCTFCGKTFDTQSYCAHGHHVCNDCANLETPAILEKVISNTRSTSPGEILEMVIAHPKLTMHGAAHHYIVPVILIAAVRNTGYPMPVEAVQQALQRGMQVPGGFCGFCGDCGAGVGLGIAVSALTMATPLNGKKRSLAMEATSTALARMCDDMPRCCKKAGRIACE